MFDAKSADRRAPRAASVRQNTLIGKPAKVAAVHEHELGDDTHRLDFARADECVVRQHDAAEPASSGAAGTPCPAMCTMRQSRSNSVLIIVRASAADLAFILADESRDVEHARRVASSEAGPDRQRLLASSDTSAGIRAGTRARR